MFETNNPEVVAICETVERSHGLLIGIRQSD